MKAMVLAAVIGKRLLPFTKDMPKPLIEVGTETLLHRNINKILDAEKKTNAKKPSLQFNVALGYGGRNDIIETSKLLSEYVAEGKISSDQINEDIFSKLSSVPVDNIDLVIRTGGDKRLSNFLLFQIAYAEIMFVETLWPDFTRQDFIACLDSFKNTERRFGKRV